MPWELGFSDACHGRIAILPVASEYDSKSERYSGQEYLGLYPYVRIGEANDGNTYLWLHDPFNWNEYEQLSYWLYGYDLTKH